MARSLPESGSQADMSRRALPSSRPLRTVVLLFAPALALTLHGCGGGSPTELVSSAEVTVEQVIEALFLGTGPAHDFRSSCGCSAPGAWSSYPRGSRVRIVMSSTVSQTGRETLVREISAFAAATAGFLSVSFERSRREDPFPGPQEITSTDLTQEEVEQLCGGPGVAGCLRIVSRRGSILDSSQAVQSTSATPGGLHLHEAAHGFGLCHVDARSVPGAVMNGRGRSGDSWTALELAAIQAVFASGLEPGATTSDFRRLGLVE